MIRLGRVVNGTIDCDSSSKAIIAANEKRKFLLFVNSSDVAWWISFGEAAVVGQGIYLAAAGGSYQIDAGNLYVGAIHAITASGDNKVGGYSEFS